MGSVPFQRPREADSVRPCSARPSTSGSVTLLGLAAGAAVPSPVARTRAASPRTRPAAVSAASEVGLPQTLPPSRAALPPPWGLRDQEPALAVSGFAQVANRPDAPARAGSRRCRRGL